MSSSPRKPMSKAAVQRWYLLGGVALLFGFAAFVNVSFYMRNNATSSGLSAAHVRAEGRHGSSASNRIVKHVVFTATCSERDRMRSQVLAFTAREQRFTGYLTYIAYNCDKMAFLTLQKAMPPHYNVAFFHAANIQGSGETELNPHALHAWTKSPEAKALPADEFVMIVEIDTIFTRTLDLAAMLHVADTMTNPTLLGQDAAWFDSDYPTYIMPVEILEATMGKSSKSVNTDNWRGNAVHAPFIMHARHMDPVFGMTKGIYDKLEQKYQHLAYPLACAELELEHGVAGSFRLSRYNSFAENWNFVDVIKYNPIQETMNETSPLYAEYPFTMRTSVLQLLKWVDGAPYVMRDRWVPLDFFQCDAVMLQLPDPSLWHYASHTYGWEQVSPILRTRHIVSIALTYQAYNRAARDIKQHTCANGFNDHQRLLLGEDIKSAVPSKLPLHGLAASTNDVADADQAFDFVFVTSCSNADQWQADMLVESFDRVKQRGSLTRIVTGCATIDELNQVYRRTSPKMKLHFAPDTASFQTTHALRHWLQHSNAPHLPSTLVVLAVDFLFLRRFVMSKSMPVVTAYPKPDEDPDPDAMEVVRGSRQPKAVFFYSGHAAAPNAIEAKSGTVIVQNFDSYLEGLTTADRVAALCPTCPKPSATSDQYNVGLPYVVSTSDLKKSIDDAAAFAEKYFQAYAPPSRLHADLIGFAVAAAKQGLSTVRLDNLALTQAASEDWHFALAKKELNSFTIEYVLENPCHDELVVPPNAAPFLRQFKRFQIASWVADPKLMPDNVFACDMWLLQEPPASLWTDAIKSENADTIKNTYGLCTTLKLWNALLVQRKQTQCPNGFNHNKRLKLVDPRPADVLISLDKPQWP
ncbi:hypothetical protein H310_10754 [Aphanomyces invadans]|uniref:Uncharacterized protein n=1 Tax=Aphanomyces invadans TaxID=157072 RepID=A0A024TRY7_9STRA|nr:hypothetical protein H310_10754 [Aphanomyces invadans]ETV96117.1 hypothetical protein H310_10754 [Aphanomyces invadans]|eukprot:XP_008875428.1 hypothetical protein H310_10754 [Aphanomyces invadans]